MRTIIFRLGIGAFCVLGMAVMVLAAVPLPYEYSPSNAWIDDAVRLVGQRYKLDG